MNKYAYIAILICINHSILFSQVGINSDGTLPDNSAMLDVKSIDRGFLLPRLTQSQVATISSPAAGLLVFCTNCSSNNTGALIIYSGTSWFQMDLKNCYAVPLSPAEGIHDSSYVQVTWDWNPVADATGYKWNSTNNYATAMDKGTSSFHSETGLTPATAYTRYVWSYNSCGYSAPTTLTATTLPCSAKSVYHVAGDVAPVTKFTVYGLAAGIPGEPNKCWITKNLGASNPAASVDDATEPSAGWYWQFNRKQGYKHTGTVRTPNTAWIDPISENSNWTAAQDPCTLELGSGWRIPTNSEWYNVYTYGSWTNWNGPWNSDLQIHAAGYLYFESGNLSGRGVSGLYWSSSQNGNFTGMELIFNITYCYTTSDEKSAGSSVRCLKE